MKKVLLILLSTVLPLQAMELTKEQEAFDCLEKTMIGLQPIIAIIDQAILEVGKALANPDLKEKAKLALMKMATFDSYKNNSHSYLRKTAWKQLKVLIDEPEVHDLFTKIAKEDERIAYRFNALNYLDKIDDHETVFSVEIIKHIISHFDVSTLSYEDGKALDYALWLNGTLAFKAIEELGEITFAQKLLTQFNNAKTLPAMPIKTVCYGPTDHRRVGFSAMPTSQSAPLYSILKFIGVHTTNQGIFNKIVTSLIKKCEGQDLGLLESLPEVLGHLRQNKSVFQTNHCIDPDRTYLPYIAPDTALSSLPTNDDSSHAYREKMIHALIDIIKNDAVGLTIRKFAIRESAQYFFTTYEDEPIKSKYKKYAQKIGKHLNALVLKESTHQDVKAAATHLLEMHAQLRPFSHY